jgi:hypothetical protein
VFTLSGYNKVTDSGTLCHPNLRKVSLPLFGSLPG